MKHLFLAAGMTALATVASANDFKPAMQSYLETEIRAWLNDPVLLDAIRAQNEQTGAFDQAEIDRLDQVWRAEVGSTSEMITGVLQNPAAEFLRQHVEQAGGIISEAFAMDAQGLNVAASDVTSDYWQGDEAKFQETFGVGAGAVHFGEVEFDESTQTYQGQVSVVIVDPESNTPIGALTIGLNAEALL